MAINLPHWLAEVINVLGFDWPEIDEDQLREAARHLRKYAHDAESSHDRSHKIVTGDLQEVYAAQSYTALAQAWAGQSSKHMKELIEACRMLATALDDAAIGVEAMKDKCIVQLGIAAGELGLDVAASAVTLGLSDLAAAAEVEVQQRLMNGIMQNFEREVVSLLVGKITGPIKEKIDHSVEKLLFAEIAQEALGAPPAARMKLDYDAILGHANTIKGESKANLDGGRTLRHNTGHLTFKTG
ncbi:hypothetical protein ACIRVK_03145 [Streptomyces sp. NPDC101152]|uniref:WXG100-like domain-containing protein n=1 Tax=Streptomyces sp. NPDC101152 TaxID=3366116 RepID=UPI0038292EBF